MANITSPEAIAFSDQRVRTIADKLAQLYYAAKAVRDEWYANNMGTLFSLADDLRDAANPLEGTGDGRHPVTGNDVTNVIVRCEEIVLSFESSSNAKLNTILAVATNPRG
jgi:hypothetical protein